MIPACVTHLEPFGAFVDVGCGVVSFIGIENISVSRIFHPRERFSCGQMIRAAVLGTDPAALRIHLTHRELLGTWAQNAALFHAGETVRGIVRSLEPYGIFIELAPNLSGLAERRAGLREGDHVSVYIKSILPERMKVKLNVIDTLRRPAGRRPRRGISYRTATSTSGFIRRPAANPSTLQPISSHRRDAENTASKGREPDFGRPSIPTRPGINTGFIGVARTP